MLLMALIEISLVYMAPMQIWKEDDCGRSWQEFLVAWGGYQNFTH